MARTVDQVYREFLGAAHGDQAVLIVALDQLRDQIAEKDAEIAALTAQLPKPKKGQK